MSEQAIYITLIQYFHADSTGYYDEEKDFIAEAIVQDLITEENVHELESLDTVMQEVAVGNNLAIDIYVFRYIEFLDLGDQETVEAFNQMVEEQFDDMIEAGSVALLENFEVVVEVQGRD